MKLSQIAPNQSINKAYRKEKVGRADIELFKKNLKEFLASINERESEEHVKNNVTNFLYQTYYQGKNQINTKGRIDLAIYEDKKPVVIIEAKRPSSPDMVSAKNLNAKAVHELVLYYLRERIDEGNTDIKFLIATNMYEWFVFDASVFDKLFYQNTALTKEYVDWKDGRKPDSTTDFFYSSIATKFLKDLKEEIEFTWFDLREIEKVVSNDDPKDDNKLVPIFKLLSPAHLLKQPFANDSNSLDTKFYSELLHIIGLEEKKDGGKKLIQRKEKPDEGSLLENAINNLVAEDHIQNLPRGGTDFGETKDERLFNVALELCITWINRILFLKLLEGQLQNYHNGDARYRFLDFKTIPTYDELNKLFFQVLAREHKERTGTTLEKFKLVPYLNSSLFEPNQLEHETLRINNLDDGLKLKLSSSTVLRNNAKKREGELPTLQYLFEFLNSYDFTSEGKEEIQEENKGLINASVLGLIFEKINGYKDGSFFTPGFITMYMCRETIRRAVVQKFKEAKGWELDSFADLHNHITPKDIKEANEIINSLKICDPAVGSGHFLVSALNEIIAIKSELGVLADQKAKVLRGYAVEVINDELIVSIDHNEFFEYKPGNKDSQRVQEALFHEKETIIENCLFGVDINPNSVKICRLRLWIELLKNAYYTEESKYIELETLPNIDINIKQGNSLISRFDLNADLSKALKSIKYSISDYRSFVNSYKNATDKEEKRGFEKLIGQIKGDFRTEISKYSDPDKKKLQILNEEMFRKYQSGQLYDLQLSDKQKSNKKKLEEDINKLSAKIQSKVSDPLFREAFEWGFEFPEVLSATGEYLGFDLVIGNPPYGNLLEENAKSYIKTNYQTVEGPFEVYKFFIEKGLLLLRSNGLLSYISPDTWINLSYFKKLRTLINQDYSLKVCSQTIYDVFNEATVDNNVYVIKKEKSSSQSFTILNEKLDTVGLGNMESTSNDIQINLRSKPKLIEKIEDTSIRLSDVIDVWRGMSAYGAANPEKPYNSQRAETEFHRPLLNGGDIGKYSIKWAGEFIKYGDWLHRARPSFIYDRPHILIQRIRNPRLKERIIATYDDKKFISSDGLSNLIIKSDRENVPFLKALTAILNSRLINYWFSFYYFDVNIKPEQLRQIPLREMNKKFQDLIIKQVDEAIKIKAVDPKSNISKIENEIDQLVYQLYGLTKDEIKIVEEIN